ncbi:hypothetical protein WL30_02565 [Burkholderia ubonensis]|uniref:POTRA domain-containing protein n=1 Tax=Burkholderia ubonensis TaxID=101571 RepID=UPI0007542DD4|nr:POTRA domain-containing protein [Burkholderia ubonensis]KWA78288.1 hypothetical protein WL30_02565 [Burkholderia ubonensis]KWB12635.1 hypothetical protein WL31_19300 [Burkholderia ubonensis]
MRLLLKLPRNTIIGLACVLACACHSVDAQRIETATGTGTVQRVGGQQCVPSHATSAFSEPTLEMQPGTPVDRIVETGVTFPVRRVVFQTDDGEPFEPLGGVSRSKLDAIVEPFVGHELGANRAHVLRKRLTDAFDAAGYVTACVMLDAPESAAGTLSIAIRIGRIATFMVKREPALESPRFGKSAGEGYPANVGYVMTQRGLYDPS